MNDKLDEYHRNVMKINTNEKPITYYSCPSPLTLPSRVYPPLSLIIVCLLYIGVQSSLHVYKVDGSMEATGIYRGHDHTIHSFHNYSQFNQINVST